MNAEKSRCGCYHHGNLHEELLLGSRRRLEETGVEGLSLRALARDLGVSQAAPYRHFHDKSALLEALAAEGFRELNRGIEQCQIGEQSCPLDTLYRSGREYVGFARRNPALFRLMLGSGDFTDHDDNENNELHLAAQAAFGGLQKIVESGVANGVFVAGEPRSLALACWAAVHGVATLLLDTVGNFWEDNEQETLIDNTLRLLCLGLVSDAARSMVPEELKRA